MLQFFTRNDALCPKHISELQEKLETGFFSVSVWSVRLCFAHPLRSPGCVLWVFFLVVVVVKTLLRGPWPAFWLKLKCSGIPPENGITRAQRPIGSDALVSTFFFSHSTSVGSSPLPSRLTLWGGDRVRNPCLQPFRSLWAASLSLGHAGDGAAAAEEERQLQRLCCAEPMPAPRPPHRTLQHHRSPPPGSAPGIDLSRRR